MADIIDRLRWEAERLPSKFSTNDELFQLLTEAAKVIEDLTVSNKDMTAKQYLRRVRKIDKEIDALLRLKQETKDRLLSTTQKYDGDGAQTSKDPHKYDRLVELESLIDSKVDEQIEMKKEIINTIMKLEDRTYRILLMEYYVEMKTWEQVAVDMNYSWRQIMNLHGYALREVQRII